MSPLTILTLLLSMAVFGDESQELKCGRLGKNFKFLYSNYRFITSKFFGILVSSIEDKTQESQHLLIYFRVDGSGSKSDHIEVTVDPANHVITSERCHRQKHFDDSSLIKITHKIAKLVDLDNVTVSITGGFLEIRAPYNKYLQKPTRLLEIVRLNETYPESSPHQGSPHHMKLFKNF